MTDVLLAVCATLGAAFGGEVPREWAITYQAFQQAAAPKEVDWMDYYKTIRPVTGYVVMEYGLVGTVIVPFPFMYWAVPNSALSGQPFYYGSSTRPIFPYSFDSFDEPKAK